VKLFPACNLNSPAPIITAIITNPHVEIVQKPRQLFFTMNTSVQINLLQQEGDSLFSFH